MLDPELALAASVQPRYDYSDPIRVRTQVGKLSAVLRACRYWRAEEELVHFEDFCVARGDGTSFAARVYSRKGIDRPAPAIVFFHGGGFMIGDLDFEHGRCLKWAIGASSVVISCDYRLSPEYKYPAALDDC